MQRHCGASLCEPERPLLYFEDGKGGRLAELEKSRHHRRKGNTLCMLTIYSNRQMDVSLVSSVDMHVWVKVVEW